MTAKTKIRTTLSIELLSAIYALTDITSEEVEHLPSEIKEVLKHIEEIDKVIGLALFKVGSGITKPVYTTKELTLEQKVERGIATKEEVEQYTANLGI